MAYARLSTRDTSGLHPNLRGLGAASSPSTLSASDALQQAIALYGGKNLNPRDIQNPVWISAVEAVIEAAKLNDDPSCATSTVPPLNLFSTASGLALTTATTTTGLLSATGAIAASTGALLGAATMGVGLIVSVIGMIFQHHAQAVKRDLNFQCAAVPAVNNAFAVIASAVQNGSATPADAAQALPEIYSNYMSAGGASGSISGPGSIPGGGTPINDSPYCNSNCEISIQLLAMVFYWQSQYQALAAQQAAAAAAAASSTTASQAATGSSAAASGLSAIPIWAWIALAVFGAWAVL